MLWRWAFPRESSIRFYPEKLRKKSLVYLQAIYSNPLLILYKAFTYSLQTTNLSFTDRLLILYKQFTHIDKEFTDHLHIIYLSFSNHLLVDCKPFADHVQSIYSSSYQAICLSLTNHLPFAFFWIWFQIFGSAHLQTHHVTWHFSCFFYSPGRRGLWRCQPELGRLLEAWRMIRFLHLVGIPIGYNIVTCTINIPQMLAYIPAPWILWDRDTGRWGDMMGVRGALTKF